MISFIFKRYMYCICLYMCVCLYAGMNIFMYYDFMCLYPRTTNILIFVYTNSFGLWISEFPIDFAVFFDHSIYSNIELWRKEE